MNSPSIGLSAGGVGLSVGGSIPSFQVQRLESSLRTRWSSGPNMSQERKLDLLQWGSCRGQLTSSRVSSRAWLPLFFVFCFCMCVCESVCVCSCW